MKAMAFQRGLLVVRKISVVYRQLFGIPDYERYIAHMAVHHPHERALSPREFYVRAIERKYGGSGPRCC